MRGRVKVFYDNKKFGFIIGEDGYEYFFHISNIISVDIPTSNSIVEFEPTESEKGKNAIKVNVLQKFEQRPEFINLGSSRIRIKDIRSYYVSQSEEREAVSTGWFSAPDYYTITTYYLYIEMKNSECYHICYNNKSDRDKDCETLDKYLSTVQL